MESPTFASAMMSCRNLPEERSGEGSSLDYPIMACVYVAYETAQLSA